MPAPDFDPDGQYADHTLLAKGARGDTWSARSTITGEPVLLKVRPKSSVSEVFAKREAALLQSIHHANVQQFHKITTVGDRLILEYAYVPGDTLREVLDREGALPPDRVRAILRDVLNGLQALHSRNVAHRDISPENIVLNETGAVLIDFDATGFLDEASRLGSTTIAGEVAGKFLYASPEALAGAPQTSATDIWALGAVFYEMTTGRPLRTETNVATIVAHLTRPPDLARLPQEARPLAARMLALDVAERPTPAALLTQLDAAEDPSDPFGPIPRVYGDVARRPAAPDPMPETALPQKSASGRSWLWITLLTSILVAAGLGALFLIRRNMLAGQVFKDTVGDLHGEFSPGPADPPQTDFLAFGPDLLIALGLVLGGLVFATLGLWLLRRHGRRPPDKTISKTLVRIFGLEGIEGRKALMKTVIGNLEPEVARGGVVPFQLAALAQEYVDAKDSAARLEALKVMIDVHHRAASGTRSIWAEPDRLIARLISVTTLAGGLVAAIEGARRLF